jgi:methylated-DNA-[protein]-cysteine S-methyltransferase
MFETPIGAVAIGWVDDVVCGSLVNAVQLPEGSPAATRARLLRLHPDAEEATDAVPADVQRAIDGVVGLLSGHADDLRDVTVDLAGLPEFHRCVYDVARGIDPGQTMTYGEIACRLGEPRAAREVGQALGANPVPLIVPCHRVLAAGGKLGGFSARGGVTTKLRLLEIEGAEPNGQPALF